ncbi:hypothetical protein OZX58_07045 [Lactobacillus sp. ESL0680]|uniref:hypothetical protein n=1 Tax=Lactobacillus sp. ESL0680 TaxID=2983210 RepID=UPI0023F7B03B|nr:hypothetical protein [Lactobacillus sp. ESL0680]WEV38484.1 hypothetical protein OZX58_07045 [Lactobacillus sp. ESL0680]
MTSKNIENANFWRLIIGQSLFTIGTSIFDIVLSFLLVKQYFSSSSLLGVFGIINVIPSTLIALLTPTLASIKKRKLILLLCQIIAAGLISIEIFLLLTKASVKLIGICQFLLKSSYTLSGSIEVGFIPIILYKDQEKINKTVNIQYISSSVLMILSGLISSTVIISFGTPVLLITSQFAIVSGIFAYGLIDFNDPNKISQITNKGNNKFSFKKYIQIFNQESKKFINTMPAFLVICSEAILGGLTGLLLQLLPITVKELGLAVAIFPLINSIQKAGDVVGGFIAPLSKFKIHNFFILDYFITGICFILISIPKINFILKLILLFSSSLTTGMSGNIFEKLMYSSFNANDISSMHAMCTSMFSICSFISYFASFIKIPTLFLWLFTGLISLVLAFSLYKYTDK